MEIVSYLRVTQIAYAVSHFVAHWNGTGRETFLQSIIPSLTYGCFDNITKHKDMNYARQFKDILQKEKYSEDDYVLEDYLSLREAAIREIFDRHCVYAACKGQGGDEWRYMRAFTITLTLCYAILPRTDKDLSENELVLLRDNLGLDIKSKYKAVLDESWQHKTQAELRQLSNDKLKTICKSYGRPFSNKNKVKLVETVPLGPLVSHSITEVEKISKYSFLQPLHKKTVPHTNQAP